ncbi:hypothetical protein BMS3Abin03_02782 [bacterium BMS3Abin03]|nr:hypothetical protein BMS3Abin03_02782 [bacterium BMS3Abin03]
MKGFIVILAILYNQFVYSQTVTLRDTTNQYDYIIITVPEFVSACIPFKEHKEDVMGLKTIIVDTLKYLPSSIRAARRRITLEIL